MALRKTPDIYYDELPMNNLTTPPKGKSLTSRFGMLRNGNPYKIVLGLAVVIIAVTIGFLAMGANRPQSAAASQVPIGKSFTLLARDSKGNSLGKNLNINITQAEKTGQVLINGQKATTRTGKLFLLIYFEIENPDKIVYYVNSADMMRFIRADGKKFAPTAHQGILEIRPNSTKNSNVGFVIDAGETNFKIEFGDLDGKLNTFEVKF